MSMRMRRYMVVLLPLLLLCSRLLVAQEPLFPPDPGELYIPPVVTIMGVEVDITDPNDTSLILTEVDVLGDSTLLYNTETNTLTFTSVNMEVGDSMTAAISYVGSDALTIVLQDSSTIFADTVISSSADVIITGEGALVAEAVVPIIGATTASITFDSVTMYVRSLSSPASVRRRIRGMKRLDENGGPALSGFATADFNKTVITPPDAEYGAIEVDNAPWAGGASVSINALYTMTATGPAVLTEFTLTAMAAISSVEDVRAAQTLDVSKPMYSILGVLVDASYKGIVVQDGRTYVLR